jgi:hypothetical protein
MDNELGDMFEKMLNNRLQHLDLDKQLKSSRLRMKMAKMGSGMTF